VFPRLFALFVLLTALVTPSCSSTDKANQKPVHPVRGEVLLNEKPAVGAFVLFVPVNEPAENPDPRPRGTVGPDGSYTLSTYGENDGAPAGDYLVAVWMDDPDQGDKLKGRYRDPGQSKLKATVKEGSNEIPTFRLK
jgi:hypothetical protein